MPRFAIATCFEYPDLHDDDRLLAEALARRGVDATPAVWDDPAVDWRGFDRVVIRSTWNYHEKPDAYRRWLESFLDRPGVLWNPPETVLGNVHKGYLLDLERAGFSIVPTELVRAGSGGSLAEILGRRGWSRAVVKPAVSAGASETWKVSDDPADAGPARLETARAEDVLREALGRYDMLVQPYLDELNDVGEWSLIFLGGEFSHALTKTPAAGDFRVQFHHGGTVRATSPPSWMIDQAARVLTSVLSPLLFARVDGVARNGRLLLMELEINEPYLGLAHAPGSADRLAAVALGCSS